MKTFSIFILFIIILQNNNLIACNEHFLDLISKEKSVGIFDKIFMSLSDTETAYKLALMQREENVEIEKLHQIKDFTKKLLIESTVNEKQLTVQKLKSIVAGQYKMYMNPAYPAALKLTENFIPLIVNDAYSLMPKKIVLNSQIDLDKKTELSIWLNLIDLKFYAVDHLTDNEIKMIFTFNRKGMIEVLESSINKNEWLADLSDSHQLINARIFEQLIKIKEQLTAFLETDKLLKKDLPVANEKENEMLFLEDAQMHDTYPIIFKTNYNGTTKQLEILSPAGRFSDKFEKFQKRLRQHGYTCEIINRLPSQPYKTYVAPEGYPVVNGGIGTY